MKLRLSTVVRLAGAVLLLAAVGGARLVQLRGLQSRQAAELAIASTDAPLGQPADAGLGIGPREEAPRVEWVRQDPASNARAGHATPQRGHGSGSGDAVAPEAEKPKVIPRPPPTKLEDISISTVPDASDAPIDIIEAQAESGARASGANTPSSASADTIGPAIPVASDTDAGSCLYPTLALAIKSGREMLLSRLPMIQATWLSEELCNVVVVAGELDGTAAGFGKSPLVDDSLRAEAKVDDGSETNEDRDDAVVASQYEQTVGSLVVLDVVTGTYAQPKDDDEEQKGIIGPRFHIRHKYRLGMAESEKSAPWEGASDWGMANKTEPELEEAAVRRRLMRRDEKHSRAPGYASRRIDPHSRPFSPAEKGKSEHEDTRTGGGTQSGWQADADKNLPGFVSLWNKFADSDWFLMIDDDTFLHLPTLDTQVLRNPRYNPEVPYFIGSAYSFSGCAYTVGGKTYDSGDFAQGGGGMLLSRGGMKKFLGVVGNCMEDLWECWWVVQNLCSKLQARSSFEF